MQTTINKNTINFLQYSIDDIEKYNRLISKEKLENLSKNYECVLLKVEHKSNLWYFKAGNDCFYTHNPAGLPEIAFEKGFRTILFGRYDTDMDIETFFEMDNEILNEMYQNSINVTANIL